MHKLGSIRRSVLRRPRSSMSCSIPQLRNYGPWGKFPCKHMANAGVYAEWRALAQRDGPARGLEAIGAIDNNGRLATYPFYFAALGELEYPSGRPAIASKHFRAALAIARNP